MSWRRFFRRARWDRERSEEIESHVQMETDENVARGMREEEARAAARRKFGNRTLVREEIYRMNTIGLVDALARDARYGLRSLRKNPTFTAAALLTLAVGIGANTAVFSVVNRVLLQPLAYPHPEQLVSLHQTATGAAGLANVADGLPLSGSMYFTYAEHNRTFQSLGVWVQGSGNVTGLGDPEQVRVIAVSDGLLQTLSVRPLLGRWFSAADQKPGSNTVLLSYGYWQRHFGGDRGIVGRSLTVDSRLREIVGVMPEGFRIVNPETDLFFPLAMDRSRLSLPGFGLQGIGRLKPGVTIREADADIARLLPVWMYGWPYRGDPRIYLTWRITPQFRPLKDEVVGDVRDVLWVVMATIGLVMLIACANVTNLLLVRADARQHELAVRAALGAGTVRIVRELLVESLLLALLGGVLGVGLADAGLRLLLALGPANLPRLHEIALDGRALGFTLALSVLSGLLFGSIPAWKHAGPRIANALRNAGRGLSLSRERHRARNLLVVGQVALALVLLVSAGLMIRTFQALRTVDPGFTDPAHVQTLRIVIPNLLVPEAERVIRIQNEIADKLAALPGVTAVGFASTTPMDGIEPNWDCIFAEGKTYPAGEVPPLRFYRNISPGFFRAEGTRLVAGRDITWEEIYGQRHVVLLSENLARELFGSPSAAIGRRVREFPMMPWHEVIGVAQDVRDNGVAQKAPAVVYWPLLMPNLFGPGPLGAPTAVRAVTFLVRSERTGMAGFLEQIRRSVWSVNASLPLASVGNLQQFYDRSLAQTSFTLVMLGIAGAMALLLGIIGIYGVIAYAVSQRRREIGIRLALGAELGAVRRMFVGDGLKLAAIGAAAGLVAAAGLMQLMKSMLFGISPWDPVTYAAVPAVLAAAAAVASYLPARRAAAVDPVEALRAE